MPIDFFITVLVVIFSFSVLTVYRIQAYHIGGHKSNIEYTASSSPENMYYDDSEDSADDSKYKADPYRYKQQSFVSVIDSFTNKADPYIQNSKNTYKSKGDTENILDTHKNRAIHESIPKHFTSAVKKLIKTEAYEVLEEWPTIRLSPSTISDEIQTATTKNKRILAEILPVKNRLRGKTIKPKPKFKENTFQATIKQYGETIEHEGKPPSLRQFKEEDDFPIMLRSTLFQSYDNHVQEPFTSNDETDDIDDTDVEDNIKEATVSHRKFTVPIPLSEPHTEPVADDSEETTIFQRNFIELEPISKHTTYIYSTFLYKPSDSTKRTRVQFVPVLGEKLFDMFMKPTRHNFSIISQPTRHDFTSVSQPKRHDFNSISKPTRHYFTSIMLRNRHDFYSTLHLNRSTVSKAPTRYFFTPIPRITRTITIEAARTRISMRFNLITRIKFVNNTNNGTLHYITTKLLKEDNNSISHSTATIKSNETHKVVDVNSSTTERENPQNDRETLHLKTQTYNLVVNCGDTNHKTPVAVDNFYADYTKPVEDNLENHTNANNKTILGWRMNEILDVDTITIRSTKGSTQPNRDLDDKTEPDINIAEDHISDCYVCGLDKTEIPDDECHQVFENHNGNRRKYRQSCPGSKKRGCFKRYLDIGEVYKELGCRSWPPVVGVSYASKEFALLEMSLYDVENGCVSSSSALLTPFLYTRSKQTVDLHARYHVCVCTGSFCNGAESISLPISMCLLILISVLVKTLLLL